MGRAKPNVDGVEVETEVATASRRRHGGVPLLSMNAHSHLMQLHHLLIGAVCALAVAGCAGTQQYPAEMMPMDVDGTYYHVTDDGVGTWETTGSARTNGLPCTWTRTTAAPATIASTIAIGKTNQTARVTVRSGEYFVSYGCQPWNKVA